ncbi:MAG: hypothetical protein WD717_01740 [Nitrosarchaeum sp.]
MDSVNLRKKKSVLRSQCIKIIRREARKWWDIKDEEKVLRQKFVAEWKSNNQDKFLAVAKKYAELVQREKKAHDELEAKYAPQIKQMKSIDRQLKKQASKNTELNSKL